MKDISIISVSRSGHNHVSHMIRSWFSKSTTVHQFENVVPEQYELKRKSRNIPETSQPIIVYRDLLNWSASWIKYCIGRGVARNMDQVSREFGYWIKTTKEALGDTNYLSDAIPLFYDEFVQDAQMRQELCRILGGTYSEEKIEFVPKGGNGSSFDGRSMNGSGSKMDVLNRYKWYFNDEGKYYQRMLKVNNSVVQYYSEKFELSTEKRKLITKIQ